MFSSLCLAHVGLRVFLAVFSCFCYFRALFLLFYYHIFVHKNYYSACNILSQFIMQRKQQKMYFLRFSWAEKCVAVCCLFSFSSPEPHFGVPGSIIDTTYHKWTQRRIIGEKMVVCLFGLFDRADTREQQTGTQNGKKCVFFSFKSNKTTSG